ncbi:nitroreductase/quinone reductase family protein, partial [Thermoactinospora rubra]|uniref:nitroreductase/quinone reductase family protein n=1 Tax=Thermoactinospora rubra TaxID=1088767 RepID=UPI00197E935B
MAAARVLDRLQTRLVDPVVRLALRTPWHDLVSRWVTALTVTGRRSGSPITIPVQYAQEGDTLHVVSRRSRTWWRNLEADGRVAVRLRGIDRAGHATVSRDPAEVAAALRAVAASAGRDTLPLAPQDAVAVTVRLEPATP